MSRFEIVTALLRGIHLAASLTLLGCLVFRQFVMPASERAWLTVVTRIGAISGGVAVVFGAVWLVAVSGTMAGATNLETLVGAVPLVARGTNFGNLVCLRLVLLVCALLLLARQHSLARAAALLASGGALALQPFLGHIGALPDGARTVLVPIEIAHLLAAGSWLGGLFPLLFCAVRAPPKLAALLCERFTPVGLVAVGTIAITALPQAGELIGGLPGLFGTQYGHMALIKLGFFALALGLACVNRLVLTTRLVSPRQGSARTWLIGSVAIEAVAVLCVVLAAAAMASSAPAAHEQPVWPFPWRPSLVAWNEPELRGELERLLIAGATGLALIGIGLALRRFRILAAVLAVVVVAPFAPALSLLLVEAFPTSYAQSTTGFSVDAIVRGKTLFAERCAACHDARNGTESGADLTAPHLWEHLDGELFWSITNGVVDPEGNALMPGFGSALTADDRWSLIDFIRARNVGMQVAKTGKWSPPVPAPATPLICAGRDADSLADLRGHVLLVIADGDKAVTVPADGSDVVTIELARGETGAPKTGECVAASATAWEAWGALAGVAPDGFAGYQAIVDGQGWLRAWLPPAATPELVWAAIADARDHPIFGGNRPEVAHHH
jgi:putative copper export protein/mono/diheme cytochrome c family protein